MATNTKPLTSMNTIIAALAARDPVEIYCARSWPIPNSPMIFGNATVTILDESNIEVALTMAVTVASNR